MTIALTSSTPMIVEEHPNRLQEPSSKNQYRSINHNFSQVICTETEADYILMETVAKRRGRFGRYEGL